MSARPIVAASYVADMLRWQLGPTVDAEHRATRLEARRRELVAAHRERLIAEAAR